MEKEKLRSEKRKFHEAIKVDEVERVRLSRRKKLESEKSGGFRSRRLVRKSNRRSRRLKIMRKMISNSRRSRRKNIKRKIISNSSYLYPTCLIS